MQRLRDPDLLAQAVSRSARHCQVAAPDTANRRRGSVSSVGSAEAAPTLLSLVGAFVLLVLVIATAAWVPA